MLLGFRPNALRFMVSRWVQPLLSLFMQHYATLPEPMLSAGHVLTASLTDVVTLTATYKIIGGAKPVLSQPVLSPLAGIPPLLAFFNSFLTNTWMSKDRNSRFHQSPRGS